MSKTKKYKYFRKNRRGKNGKNSKHKTRRVQRGGNGNETHPTASLHLQGSHPPLPKPPSVPSEKLAAQPPNQLHAQQQPTQASNQPHTEQQPTHQPPDTGVGLNPLAHTGSNKGTSAEPLGASHGATPDAHNPKAAPVSAVAQQGQQAAESSTPPQPEAVVPTGASSGAATQTDGNYGRQPMGNGLGYQPTGYEPSAVSVSNANQVPSGSSVPNISDSKPRLTSLTPQELKDMSDEVKIAYLSRNAIARNEARQEPDERITLLANTIPAAILGRLASIGRESQENLVKEEVLVEFTKEFPRMMKDSKEVREAVEYYNKLLLEEIKEIYREIEATREITEENKNDISNLQSIVKSNIEFINQAVIEPSLLRHAFLTGSLAVAGSQYAPPDPSPPSSKSDKKGIFSGMGEKLRNFGKSISRKNKNYQKLEDESGDKNKEPGFFKRMFSRKNNKVAPEPPAGTPAETPEVTSGETPEVTQAVETPEAKRKRELDELYKTHGLTRSPGGLTRFTQGVAKKYNNAMGAVKKGFTDFKQKFSTTSENERLLDYDSNDSAAQKKTWKEKFTFKNMKESAREGVKSLRKTAKSVKDAAVNQLTRKKNNVTSTSGENGRLLSNEGNKVEIQKQEATEPIVPPPLPPPRPASSPESVSSQASKTSSDSKLSQRSTVDKSDPTDVNDFELPSKISTQPPPVSPRQTTSPNYRDDDVLKNKKINVKINDIMDNSPLSNTLPLLPPPLLPPPNTNPRGRRERREQQQLEALAALAAQAAGGKTRKNRQYIHEIKENRTHLFNKEMQILNSIRNFKNGQHHGPNERGKNKPENIQKKFIKVIKRS